MSLLDRQGPRSPSPDDAVQALTSAGFTVQYSGDPNATVTATDPPAGTPTPTGSPVKLSVKSDKGNGNNTGGNG